MNFQEISPINTAEFYLNIAINRAKKHVLSLSISTKDEDKKASLKEKARVRTISDSLGKSLSLIINSFPGLDGLPEFYYELCENIIDVDNVKKSLSVVSWAPKKIVELDKHFCKNIRGKNKKEIINARKAFLGRVSSIMKRLDKHLELIEQTRRLLVTFPDIKEDLFTVCISGFPNVGKSTLLSKITTSKPEIGSYAFTTKTLNTGYFKVGFEKVQVVDVPGSLNRFEKMNNVEKQAFLAIKYLADIIVYVYDLTEPYPLSKQKELLENNSSFGKGVVIYFSKADLLGETSIKEFASINNIEEFAFDADSLIKLISKKKKELRRKY